MEVLETTRSITPNSFIPIATFAGMGVIYSIVLLVFNCRYKSMRLVKMSSPNINVMILIGAMFLYLTCILYGLEALSSGSSTVATFACRAWSWMVSISFTLLFGSLFAKSWRVHRIFRSVGMKRTVIKDEKLVAIVMGLVMVDVIILGIWQGVDPLHSLTVFFYESKESSVSPTVSSSTTNPETTVSTTGSNTIQIISHQTCSSDYVPIWIFVLLVYKGIILFYGTYLSWVIRHVTLPSMNDSTCIIISCHVTTIVSAAAISLAVIFKEWPEAVYACVGAAIWLSTTVTLTVEFLPKIRLWQKKNAEEDSLKVSISSQVFTSPGQTFEQMEEEMYHLVAENRALKKSLSMKDVTIQSLQDHVTSAKEKLTHLLDGNDSKEDSGVNVTMPTPIPREQADNDSGHAGDDSNECIEPPSYSRGVSCDLRVVKESTPASPKSSVRSFRMKRRASLRSLASHASDVQKFTELRDAIAVDLEHAKYISANLRNAISKDLTQANSDVKSETYRYVRSKQDLSGAIAGSYDLDDNCDTYSYVSNHLPRRPASVASSCATSSSLGRHSRCSSCDSVSALSSDQMYPANVPGATPRTHRHDRRASPWRQSRSRRTGRRHSWKRPPVLKTYSLQEPRAPYVNQVGVAFRRDLSDIIV